MRIATTVLHVLPLPHHAKRLVVQTNDLHRQVVLHTGREFLQIHLEATLTGDTHRDSIWKRQLHAHRRWETEAHSAETARINPTSWLIEAIVLSRKHLVLTHVRRNIRVSFSNAMDSLHDLLRFDDTVSVRSHAERILLAPLRDLLPPRLKRFCIARLLRPF